MEFIKGVFHSVLTAVLSTCIIVMFGIGTIAATDINSFFDYVNELSIQSWIFIIFGLIGCAFFVKIISKIRRLLLTIL